MTTWPSASGWLTINIDRVFSSFDDASTTPLARGRWNSDVGNEWPRTIVQTCEVHLIRGSYRYAGRQAWDKTRRAAADLHR